ncbi:uncharacterized protein LOC127081807 [Lathyrus oleraceus]|uniref:uncharacterized protein LOC127081807 n=1 Tax=Pisum sativum TaxID=3888 RepID=UPI0021CE7292|nr:uncharacterized protein LOC127081807 [Pisum sativum]
MNAIKLESTKPHLTNEEVSGMNATKLESIELGKEMEKSIVLDRLSGTKNIFTKFLEIPKGDDEPTIVDHVILNKEFYDLFDIEAHLATEKVSGMNGKLLESPEVGKEMEKSIVLDHWIGTKIIFTEFLEISKGDYESIVLDRWSGTKNIFTEFLEISKGADKSTIVDQVILNKNFVQDEVVSLPKWDEEHITEFLEISKRVDEPTIAYQVIQNKNFVENFGVVAVLKNQILRVTSLANEVVLGMNTRKVECTEPHLSIEEVLGMNGTKLKSVDLRNEMEKSIVLDRLSGVKNIFTEFLEISKGDDELTITDQGVVADLKIQILRLQKENQILKMKVQNVSRLANEVVLGMNTRKVECTEPHLAIEEVLGMNGTKHESVDLRNEMEKSIVLDRLSGVKNIFTKFLEISKRDDEPTIVDQGVVADLKNQILRLQKENQILKMKVQNVSRLANEVVLGMNTRKVECTEPHLAIEEVLGMNGTKLEFVDLRNEMEKGVVADLKNQILRLQKENQILKMKVQNVSRLANEVVLGMNTTKVECTEPHLAIEEVLGMNGTKLESVDLRNEIEKSIVLDRLSGVKNIFTKFLEISKRDAEPTIVDQGVVADLKNQILRLQKENQILKMKVQNVSRLANEVVLGMNTRKVECTEPHLAIEEVLGMNGTKLESVDLRNEMEKSIVLDRLSGVKNIFTKFLEISKRDGEPTIVDQGVVADLKNQILRLQKENQILKMKVQNVSRLANEVVLGMNTTKVECTEPHLAIEEVLGMNGTKLESVDLRNEMEKSIVLDRLSGVKNIFTKFLEISKRDDEINVSRLANEVVLGMNTRKVECTEPHLAIEEVLGMNGTKLESVDLRNEMEKSIVLDRLSGVKNIFTKFLEISKRDDEPTIVDQGVVADLKNQILRLQKENQILKMKVQNVSRLANEVVLGMNTRKVECTEPHLAIEEVLGMNGTKLESVDLRNEMEKSIVLDRLSGVKNIFTKFLEISKRDDESVIFLANQVVFGVNTRKLESTKPHLNSEEVSGMNGTKLEFVELGKEMEKNIVLDRLSGMKNIFTKFLEISKGDDEPTSVDQGVVADLKNQILRLQKENQILTMKSTIVDQVILNKNFVEDEVVSIPKSIVLDRWSGTKNIFTEFLEISKGADEPTIVYQVILNKNFVDNFTRKLVSIEPYLITEEVLGMNGTKLEFVEVGKEMEKSIVLDRLSWTKNICTEFREISKGADEPTTVDEVMLNKNSVEDEVISLSKNDKLEALP